MRGAESSGTTHTGTVRRVRLFSLFVTDNFKLVYWVQLAALQAPPVAPAARYVCALSEVSRLDSPPPHVRGIGCAGCCILHERRFAPARARPQTFSKGGCPRIPQRSVPPRWRDVCGEAPRHGHRGSSRFLVRGACGARRGTVRVRGRRRRQSPFAALARPFATVSRWRHLGLPPWTSRRRHVTFTQHDEQEGARRPPTRLARGGGGPHSFKMYDSPLLSVM